MYKSLIVNDVRSLNEITDEKLCIFVECEIDTIMLFKLIEIADEKSIIVFKSIRNKLATIDIFAEQKLILENLNNIEQLELENYVRYDLNNSQFDEYLDLQNVEENDEIESVISNVRISLNERNPHQVIDQKWLLENNKGNFVVEYYEQVNNQLNQDINELFRFIDANFIVITSDYDKLYTCTNEIGKNDRIIAKSSNIVEYKYFFIPDSKTYVDPLKLVLINDYDFKYAFSYLMTGEYIIGFKDNLRYSNYFMDNCKSFKVPTTMDYIPKSNIFINQNMESIALINIVLQEEKLDVYEIENGLLKMRGTVYKDSDEFHMFILDYKNTLYNKQVQQINLEVLFPK